MTMSDDISEAAVATEPGENHYHINPANVEGWKAQARAAGAGEDIYVVTVEGCASDIVIRRPTKAEWLDYFNKSLDVDTAEDAHVALCTKCVLWVDHRAAKRRGPPPKSQAELVPAVFQTIAAIAADMVAFRLKLVDKIEDAAGWTDKDPYEAPLTRETPGDVLERFGVDQEAVTALLERYSQTKMSMVSVSVSPDPDAPEHKVFVVRKPDPASFTAFRRDSAGKAKAEARHALAVACTVYPGTTDGKGVNAVAQQALAAYPGAAAKICDPIVRLGGASARTTAKKL